jgi:hypothetical protein
MSKGIELRAQMDSENVKGLLLINGGGAIALLAFLPSVLGKPEYKVLAKAILWALLMFQMGLLTAVVHNRLRRICSLVYENERVGSPPEVPQCLLFKRFFLREPCVCCASIAFMWASTLLFFAAGIVVLVGGLCVI